MARLVRDGLRFRTTVAATPDIQLRTVEKVFIERIVEFVWLNKTCL